MIKRMAVLLPVVAGIMFGSVGLFVRTLSENGLENSTILFTRVLFATLLMLIFLMFYDRRLLKIRLKDLYLFVGTGVLGMMGLNLCYNNAINSLSLSLAAVLLSTAPVFVIINASILFKEKITTHKVGCMVLVIIGCIFASGLLENQLSNDVTSLGILFGIGSAFFYSLYSIFSRLATDKEYHTYTVIFYSVLLITIVLLPFADIIKITGFIGADPINNLVFLCLHGLCTSVIPYIFITMALLYVETGKVSILASGSEPAAASIFGLMFYMEKPTILTLLGLVITIVALSLLCVYKKE